MIKTLIIYDSLYGNTEKVALAIASVIPQAKAEPASAVHLLDLKALDLLIVGSPVHGGRPSQKVQEFLNKIPATGLKGIAVVVFDTRFLAKDQNFALRLLMKIIGYTAPKIATSLKTKGGDLIVPAEGFIVKGKEGPLKDGELVRARSWAKQILKAAKK